MSFDFVFDILRATSKFDSSSVTTLVEFYEAHDKLSDFIQWAGNNEVDIAGKFRAKLKIKVDSVA